MTTSTQRPVALLSAYDKTGIVELAQGLVKLGWDIVSSGRTARVLANDNIPVTDVAELTGYPAILGHRVVTLHPKVHGGILAIPTDPEHQRELEQYDIRPISLVVVNLYPFEQTVTSDASREECIEMIDIGGPAMVRASAKNHDHVGVVANPDDYDRVLEELRKHGELTADFRRGLAVKAFGMTQGYDAAIVEWLSGGTFAGLFGWRVAECDYGENRWQSPAALYGVDTDDPLALYRFEVIKGRTPSYINWTDVDRLLQTVTHIVAGYELNHLGSPYVAVAVKHGNPCGAAVGETPEEAIQRMVTGDPRAVFGAVVMVNFRITEELAYILRYHAMESGARLLDGVCAPAFDDEAPDKLSRKDGKYFLAVNPALGELDLESLDPTPLLRPVRGGFLRQPNYEHVLDLDEAMMRGADIADEGLRDLILSWAVCATSNSNTVSIVKDGQLIGNGVGQQDRVGCCELAIAKAREHGHDLAGAVAASDSFFPFTDGPQLLIDAGVKAIYSTTGSKNDALVQLICEQHGITLVQLPDADGRGFYRH